MGSFLTDLLNSLTHNEFVLKDSFDATAKIDNVPPQLFDNGYIFASFDVTSLFTNVPLNRTVNIILDRVYNESLVNASLRMRTLKKLIKDTCSKIGNKSFDAYTYDINSIQKNTNIIDSAKNWNILLIKEVLNIKMKIPILKSGLKASKELRLLS